MFYNGTSWSTQTSGTGSNLFSLSFADTSNGWAVGASGTIRRTSNGGSSWSTQTSLSTANLQGIVMARATRGFIVADSGDTLFGMDGATWIQSSSQFIDFSFTPSLASGSAVASVVATLIYELTVAPGSAKFWLFASGDTGTTWAAYALTAPSAKNVLTQSAIDLSAQITSTALLSNLKLRFFVEQGPNTKTTHDLVHVDIN